MLSTIGSSSSMYCYNYTKDDYCVLLATEDSSIGLLVSTEGISVQCYLLKIALAVNKDNLLGGQV